jgi:proton-translocating NADH-quinone oxidoreductase chain L
MYLSVLALPLMGFLICSIGGRYIGGRGAQIISTGLLMGSVLVGCLIFYEVCLVQTPVYLDVGSWIPIIDLRWGFLFDSLTAVLILVVTVISSLVHFYSIGYMEGDPHFPRFMAYLSLFTFAMLVLVTADNFVQMFLGWEGVGIVSYLLINFWFTRLQANKSGIKALVVNRIGDWGLVLALVIIYSVFKGLDYQSVFSLVPYLVGETIWGFDKLEVVALFLFLGAIGKSAQLGLHMWLPDAMEGPTPVSALIHAATMVTAGVVLILRTSMIFEKAPHVLIFVTVLGGLTAFVSASIGLVQNDLKRVIAYSTCSQLGYMIFACGLSHYSLSCFHLVTHAFFKALLFLSAGVVIHGFLDEQDMRRMGGVFTKFPLTYSLMCIGSFSLLGFPFLSGYYSKDLILEVAGAQWGIATVFVYLLGSVTALFTAYYSIRVLMLTFWLPIRGGQIKSQEGGVFLLFPLLVLASLSIFVGYFVKDMLVGIGSGFWNNALIEETNNLVEGEFLPFSLKMFPIFLAFLGLCLSFSLVGLRLELVRSLKGVYGFLSKKWYFDKIINELLVAPILNVGYQVCFKFIDQGVLQIFGPVGSMKVFSKISKDVRSIQTGQIYHYVFMFVLGIVFLLAPFESFFLFLGLLAFLFV